MPGLAGFNCKSEAVVLTSFCSSPVKLPRLSVKVSTMWNSIRETTKSSNQAQDSVTEFSEAGGLVLLCVHVARDSFCPFVLDLPW